MSLVGSVTACTLAEPRSGIVGATTRVAAWLAPPREAVRITGITEATGRVVIEKEAMAAPAGMVTWGGARTTSGFVLFSITVRPPAGAGRFDRTVPVIDWPPATWGESRVNETREGGKSIRAAV